MQDSARKTLIFTAIAALLAILSTAAQAANCSNATVKGDWALTLSGTLLLPTGPVPAAAIVRATLNLDGTVTGSEARNVGGGYADETMSGNYTVNSDCTGSATVSFYEIGQLVRTSTLAIIFDDNGKQVRMVQKSLTLPNGAELPVVILVEGKKQGGGGSN